MRGGTDVMILVTVVGIQLHNHALCAGSASGPLALGPKKK